MHLNSGCRAHRVLLSVWVFMEQLLATHPRLVMFAQNICLLIFLLTIAVVGLVLLIATWTGTRIALWKREQAQAEAQLRRKRLDADGNALPPAGRGICESCQRASDAVLHLSDGTRRCRACYDAALRTTPADPVRVDH
jgi:hypothetical protein